jgi:Tol biopolymer transport system component
LPHSPGERFGPYEIVSPLGAGGMGEVYKARDTRLGRDVALKVLRAPFVVESERLRRFEQEAQAAASLNHPNIVAVFDVGDDKGTPYVVSELLEGETLRARLRSGALGVRCALDYAMQLAHGLEAAHQKGIVHRDLKPENVFVTRDGRVKILDFGLAKLRDDAAPVAASLSTMTAITVPGAIVGTLGYMSPEQLRAQPVDHRTDIFAFGAIFYEMLSGQRAFRGSTAADALGAILMKDPEDLALTNNGVPVALNLIVRHSLEKAADQRFQSAHDLALTLEAISTAKIETRAVSGDVPGANRMSRRPLLARVLLASVAGLAVVTAAVQMRERPAARPIVRVTLTLPDALVSPRGLATQLAVSPDGKYIVFTAQVAGDTPHLWLRAFDSAAPRSIPGTEDAGGPFWSPDSGHVAFFSGGKLKRVSISDGGVQTICDLVAAIGAESSRESSGTWSGNGTILFGIGEPGQPLFRLRASGGEVVAATRLGPNELKHSRPDFLGDSRHFMFSADTAAGDPDVYVGDLDGPARQLLKRRNGGAPRYVAPNHLVFTRERTLLAQPFDLKRFVPQGEPTVIADDLPVEGSGTGLFGVSQTGILVYRTGSNPMSQLAWFDRSGRNLGLVGDPGNMPMIALSPDARRLAYALRDLATGTQNIWVADLNRNVSTRLTFETAVDADPVWSPDGRAIAFASLRGGRKSLFMIPSIGGAERILLASTVSPLSMDAWSRDGRFFLYHANPARELLARTVVGDDKPFVIVRTRVGVVDEPSFSPDGRWVAYDSDESGRFEIYVKRFPPTGDVWHISTAGGVQPHWRNDGRELFFLALDGTLTSVDVRVSDVIEAGQPRALFRTRVVVSGGADQYAVTPDGQRFLVMQPFGEYRMMPFAAVLNWPLLTSRSGRPEDSF